MARNAAIIFQFVTKQQAVLSCSLFDCNVCSISAVRGQGCEGADAPCKRS